MERSKDADHLATYSEVMYPAGPNVDGEISYVHLPPLSPLNVTVIAIACIAIAAFLCCYFYPIIQWRRDARTATTHHVKRPVLASARSLFGLRPRTPPTTPQLLARYGRLDMRIARPPPALSRIRGSSHSPSLSPSLSSSCSSTPSSIGTPPVSSFALPEVIVTPVDMGILGQAVESRTTPKKGGDHYDGGKQEDE